MTLNTRTTDTQTLVWRLLRNTSVKWLFCSILRESDGQARLKFLKYRQSPGGCSLYWGGGGGGGGLLSNVSPPPTAVITNSGLSCPQTVRHAAELNRVQWRLETYHVLYGCRLSCRCPHCYHLSETVLASPQGDDKAVGKDTTWVSIMSVPYVCPRYTHDTEVQSD